MSLWTYLSMNEYAICIIGPMMAIIVVDSEIHLPSIIILLVFVIASLHSPISLDWKGQIYYFDDLCWLMDLLFAPFEYLIFVIYNNYFSEPKKRENPPVYGSIGTATDLIDRSYHANKIKMHASSDDPLHESEAQQSAQCTSAPRHVKKICLGFVLFWINSRISNLRMKSLKTEKSLHFARFVCMPSAELIPYAINEIREWCDFLFVSFDVCCQFLSQFFPCERQNTIKISSSIRHIREERKTENLLLSEIFDLCNGFIHCHSCGSDVFSI